jgi:hypothetical protein
VYCKKQSHPKEKQHPLSSGYDLIFNLPTKKIQHKYDDGNGYDGIKEEDDGYYLCQQEKE